NVAAVRRGVDFQNRSTRNAQKAGAKGAGLFGGDRVQAAGRDAEGGRDPDLFVGEKERWPVGYLGAHAGFLGSFAGPASRSAIFRPPGVSAMCLTEAAP